MRTKRTTREDLWYMKYIELKDYVLAHGHLPDKKKEEHRALLNWWKYNKRLIKQGKQSPFRTILLEKLSNLRTGRITPLLPPQDSNNVLLPDNEQ